MTAVMVSPALKAQKQELSLQDRVTYNMKVLIAIRQTSQKDLAQAMGIAAPTLSQKFSGRTRWNMDDIEKASDFLDVKPEALVAGHGFEPWTSGFLPVLGHEGVQRPQFVADGAAAAITEVGDERRPASFVAPPRERAHADAKVLGGFLSR